MKPLITTREALSRPDLFGPLLSGESWASWRVLLIAICGEKLNRKERRIFKSLTGGREVEPGKMVSEAWLAIGRRGGKTRAVSVLAARLALCNEHPSIVAGETAIVAVLAGSMQQAGVAFRYILATVEASPMLRPEIVARGGRDSVDHARGARDDIANCVALAFTS
jgi:phage terminase large subunit-like protein